MGVLRPLIPLFISISVFGQNPESFLIEINTAEEDSAKLEAYVNLYDHYGEFNRKKAFQTLDEIAEFARTSGYEKARITYHQLKGEYYYEEQNGDSAVYNFKRCFELLPPDTDEKKIANTLNNIGLGHQVAGRYDSALNYFDSAAELYTRASIPEKKCAVLNNMGISIYYSGNPEESLKYFELAYQCMIDENEPELLPRVINNYASLSAQTGNPGADSILLSLLDNDSGQIDFDTKAACYQNLGSFHFKMSNLDKAEHYFEIADSIYRKTQNPANLELLHSLGNLKMRQYRFKEADAVMRSVLKEIHRYHDPVKLYRDMAECQFAMERYDSAQVYYEKAVDTLRALTGKSVEEALERAGKHAEVIEREGEIKTLRAEQKLLEAEKRQFRTILFFIALLIPIIAAGSVFYVKKERSRKKLKELEAERARQKLVQLKSELARRDALIEEVENKLANLNEEKNIKEKLKNDIIEKFNLQSDSETFNLYFNDQHRGFYRNLKKHCEELTDNDLRMCSLSSMRLSLKETADILNISVDAVKSARYRLKKKLDLPPEENLSDFLNRFK